MKIKSEGTIVPYFRLELDDDEINAAVNVLRSGWLTTGPQISAFEREFGEFVGGGVQALAVASNTAGLHLVLEALGIGPGDEVIVPTLTFTATAEVVRYLGAEVSFVDVDPDTLCIDPKAVEAAITSRTRAIMPVHFGGRPCDMAEIWAIANSRGIPVVDDAAHAVPTEIDGVHIGAGASAAAVFSFYANKTLTTGEGGMIVSRDPKLIARCKVMRLHGIDRDSFERFTSSASQWRYDIVAPGFKYNLSDIVGSLGRTQLARVEKHRAARQRVAMRYFEGLANLPLVLPALPAQNQKHSWHLFPVQLPVGSEVTRDDLEEGLSRRGVGYSVHYTPLHQMTYWRTRYRLSDTKFPVATSYASRCLSLPIFPSMQDHEVSHVIEVLHDLLASPFNQAHA
jgi:dTDP-4-amino-4,6-dideoxygalactose transaminase